MNKQKVNKQRVVIGVIGASLVLTPCTAVVAHYATQHQQMKVQASDVAPNSLTDPTHNPTYHLFTQEGWSNDVQSIVYNEKGNYYDIYFLQAPKGALDYGTTVWYHTTTKDFQHFSKQNVAIGVGKGGESWYGTATGSVVVNQGNIKGVPKGAKVCYFTGYHDQQDIFGAYSDDNGKTFSHVLNDGKPIINWQNGSGDKNNFRDADVFYKDGKMFMYTAEGSNMGIYSSDDGLSWNKENKISHDVFAKGIEWKDDDVPVECPVVKSMKAADGQTKDVLFWGGKNTANGETTGTYYVVGKVQQNGSFVAETNVKRVDLGSDFYATNFSGSDDLSKVNDSLIALGWIGNWNYTGSGVYDIQNPSKYDEQLMTGHLGSYSIPRKLTLSADLTLTQSPIYQSNKEVVETASVNTPLTTDGKKQSAGDDNGTPKYTLVDKANQSVANIYKLKFSTNDNTDYKGRIYLDLWQGGDYIKFNYDASNGWMQVDSYASELNNDKSGMTASDNYHHTYGVNTGCIAGKDLTLTLLTDNNCVELFFPNGQSYTIARFSIKDTQDVKIYTQGENKQLEVKTMTPDKVDLNAKVNTGEDNTSASSSEKQSSVTVSSSKINSSSSSSNDKSLFNSSKVDSSSLSNSDKSFVSSSKAELSSSNSDKNFASSSKASSSVALNSSKSSDEIISSRKYLSSSCSSKNKDVNSSLSKFSNEESGIVSSNDENSKESNSSEHVVNGSSDNKLVSSDISRYSSMSTINRKNELTGSIAHENNQNNSCFYIDEEPNQTNNENKDKSNVVGEHKNSAQTNLPKTGNKENNVLLALGSVLLSFAIAFAHKIKK